MEKNSALLRDRPIKVINKRTNLPAWQVLACLGSAAGLVTELTPGLIVFFLPANCRHPGDVAEDEEGSVVATVATVAICRGVAAGTAAGTVVAVAVSRLIRLSA